MKTSISLLFVLVSYLPLMAQFRYVPERLKVDGTVSFTYTPGGVLAQETGPIQAIFFPYGSPSDLRFNQAGTAVATLENGVLTGTIKVPFKNVSGLLVAFQSKANPRLVDHNNAHFYPVPLYGKTGAILPHATGGQGAAMMRSSFPYLLKVKPDWAWVIERYDQEMERNPTLRSVYWADRIRASIQQATPDGVTVGSPAATNKPVYLAEINAYLTSQQPTPTPADLTAAAQLYDLLKESQLALAARSRIKSVDPNRPEAQKQRAEAMQTEPDVAKRRASFDAFVVATPKSPYRLMAVNAVADGYFKAGKLKELIDFWGAEAALSTDPALLLAFAQQLTNDGRGAPQAEWLTRRAMWAFQKKPVPPADQAGQLRAVQAALAAAVDQQGRFLPAMTLYRETATGILPKQTDPRTNERTWLCARKIARADSVWPFIEQIVLARRTTTALRSDLHAWLTLHLTDGVTAKKPAYQRTLALLDRADRLATLTATFIDEAAPDFTLKTLDGRKASLAALRGKIAVLHFWATSCDAYLASFTAQQKAITDPRVQHLFVNTREANPIKQVRAAASKLPNRAIVPLDPIQTMSTAYAVQNLPTLIIIDPNGRIRYRSPVSNTPEQIAMVIEALKE